jgi:hypothetical protein
MISSPHEGWLRIVATGLLLCSSIEPASATDAVMLAPAGPWSVNYDLDSCSVLRSFGEGDGKVLMRLTWFQPGDTFQLMLLGKALRTSESASPIVIAFGPGHGSRGYRSMNGDAAGQPMRIVLRVRLDNGDLRTADARAPRITAAQEHAVYAVDVTLDGFKRLHLQLGSMGAVMASVRACNRDMVQQWGFDPDKEEALSRRAAPRGSPGEWLTTDDYPAAALNRNANGLVRFRLGVSETGAVTDCKVQTSIKPVDFDTLSCALIQKRARFSPALDASGKPVASYYVNSVNWRAL